MTFPEFDEYQKQLIDQVTKMRDTKGKEYANSASRFANFDRLAESLGLSNIQVGWVYTAKHLDAIAQYCRTQETHSIESIEGRIVDAITYLILIGGMIHEKTESMQTRLTPNARTQSVLELGGFPGLQNMQAGIQSTVEKEEEKSRT
jgi:hypothetical protein